MNEMVDYSLRFRQVRQLHLFIIWCSVFLSNFKNEDECFFFIFHPNIKKWVLKYYFEVFEYQILETLHGVWYSFSRKKRKRNHTSLSQKKKVTDGKMASTNYLGRMFSLYDFPALAYFFCSLIKPMTIHALRVSRLIGFKSSALSGLEKCAFQ